MCSPLTADIQGMNPAKKVFYRLWNIRHGPEEFYFSNRMVLAVLWVFLFAGVLLERTGTDRRIELPSLFDLGIAFVVASLVDLGIFYADRRLSGRRELDKREL